MAKFSMASRSQDLGALDLSSVLTAVAAVAVSLPVALFAIGSSALYANVELSALLFVLAIAFSLVYGISILVSLNSQREKNLFLIILSATISIIFINTIINYWILDFSYDGQNYHLRAIILLRDGWNPTSDSMLFSSVDDQRIVHFPKATWIVAAILSTITGSIETGKAFNLLFLIVGLLLALAAVSAAKPPMTRQKFLFSVLLALNPIHIKQLFTNYVDGQVAFFIFSLLCVVIILQCRRNYLTISLCIMIIIYGVNTKFTALIFSVLILGPYLAIRAVRRTQQLRTAGLIAIAFLLGVGLFGYHPYVQNTVAHGKPFYPFGAANLASYSDLGVPSNLSGHNQVVKLFYGVFGEAERTYGAPANLKVPFTIRVRELKDLASYGTTVGGFGPFFNVEILLMTGWLLLIVRWWKRADKDFLILAAIVLVSVVVFPEPWNTRFIPQLWLVPLLIFMASIGTSNARFVRLFGALLICFAALNALVSAGGSVAAVVWKNYGLYKELATLATANGTVEVSTKFAPAVLHERLNARGVEHHFTENLSCPETVVLSLSRARVCFPKQTGLKP